MFWNIMEFFRTLWNIQDVLLIRMNFICVQWWLGNSMEFLVFCGILQHYNIWKSCVCVCVFFELHVISDQGGTPDITQHWYTLSLHVFFWHLSDAGWSVFCSHWLRPRARVLGIFQSLTDFSLEAIDISLFCHKSESECALGTDNLF